MRKRTLFSSGSVALADILANSVAVILILIIVTLNVAQERAEQEVETNADLTSILGRQIASNIVFNELPTSPAARLHNYKSCAIAHDCNPMLAPILELHQGYVRLFNINTRIYRSELLRPNNPLDRYINTFTPNDRNQIRIDVHAVSEYYIAMAILREHGIKPRHWHYLGEHVPELTNVALAEKATVFGEQQQQQQKPKPGDGKLDDLSQGRLGQKSDISRLEGMDLADAQMMQALQYDSLLPSDVTGESSDFLGTGSQQQGKVGLLTNTDEAQKELSLYYDQPIFDKSDYLAAAKSALLDRQAQGGGRSMRLHIPNLEYIQGRGDSDERIQIDIAQQNQVILAYLLKILELAQQEKTLNLTGVKRWFKHYAINADLLDRHPHYKLISHLDKQLISPAKIAGDLVNQARTDPAIGDNQLLTIANHRPSISSLIIHQKTPWLVSILDETTYKISMVLRLYASLFKGEVLDLPDNWTILLHPEQLQLPQMRWRPIAVLDANLEDISLGFIYAAIDDNRLVIDAGANQLALNDQYITSPNISQHDEHQSLAPPLWLIALIILFILIWRYRL